MQIFLRNQGRNIILGRALQMVFLHKPFNLLYLLTEDWTHVHLLPHYSIKHVESLMCPDILKHIKKLGGVAAVHAENGEVVARIQQALLDR